MTEDERAKQQDYLRRIREFRLLDDDFMTKCFEGDPKYIQFVLRIILDMPDLVVHEVKTQVFVENLVKRSLRLDVLATDGRGRRLNVEIQRSDKGAEPKRARYHSSAIDILSLPKGEDFGALPETYVIFITEHDFFQSGLPVYHIDRYIAETRTAFGDDAHILYVNGAYRGNDPIGMLMHDFACPNPDEMYYQVLAERTRYFKESQKGVITMSRAFEEVREIGRQEGIQEGIEEGIEKGRQEGIEKGRQETQRENAMKMLAFGKNTLEEISIISGLSLEELKKLQVQLNPA